MDDAWTRDDGEGVFRNRSYIGYSEAFGLHRKDGRGWERGIRNRRLPRTLVNRSWTSYGVGSREGVPETKVTPNTRKKLSDYDRTRGVGNGTPEEITQNTRTQVRYDTQGGVEAGISGKFDKSFVTHGRHIGWGRREVFETEST